MRSSVDAVPSDITDEFELRGDVLGHAVLLDWIEDLPLTVHENPVVAAAKHLDDLIALPGRSHRFRLVDHIPQPQDPHHPAPTTSARIEGRDDLAAQPEWRVIDDDHICMEGGRRLLYHPRAQVNRVVKRHVDLARLVAAVNALRDGRKLHVVAAGGIAEVMRPGRASQNQS